MVVVGTRGIFNECEWIGDSRWAEDGKSIARMDLEDVGKVWIIGAGGVRRIFKGFGLEFTSLRKCYRFAVAIHMVCPCLSFAHNKQLLLHLTQFFSYMIPLFSLSLHSLYP